MTSLMRQGLPQAVETERVVLGALQSDIEAQDAILGAVDPDDFSTEAHRLIVSAAMDLRDSGEHLDRVTLARKLIDKRQLEAVGGMTYLADLDADLPKIYGLDSYLKTLREKSILRKAAIACSGMVERLCAPGAGITEVREAEEFLRALSAHADNKLSLLSMAEFLDSRMSVEQFLNPERDSNRVVETPWAGLNGMLSGGGLKPGQLVILAARPGIGKSACASSLALYAGHQGHGVGFFSLEMSTEEVFQRMVACEAQISLSALQKGNLSEIQARQAQGAMVDIAERHIRVDDTSGATIPAIIGTIRRHNAKLQRPISLAIVDYLQLLGTTRKRSNRNEEVSALTRDLKLAARELRIPFVVLAQLNRDVERQEREPELHDLRESGSIEQDADTVMFLHINPREKREAWEQRRPARVKLLVRKQRNGPIGARELEFDGKYMRLTEVG